MSTVPASTSERKFFGVSALLFGVSAVGTVVWCGSMTPEGSSGTGMTMPGGWTMSMAWMRMPGQSWRGAALSFLGMWIVMMVAMMLPSLVPMLRRFRRAVATTGAQQDRLTVLAGLGYFSVWTLSGVVAFPCGIALAALAMQWPEFARMVPIVAGAIVTIAGGLQFSAWKSRQLACCRRVPGRHAVLAPQAMTAWRYGLRLGVRCSYCCAGLTATLFALGVMDLHAMAVITLAISLERLAPAGVRCARGIGAVLVVAGLLMIVRAIAES